MNKGQVSASFLPISLVISIGGLALIIFMVLQLNVENSLTLTQRNPIGAIFCVLCLLGIAAVFYPVKCRVAFNPVQERNVELGKVHSSIEIIGHHPGCQEFEGNRIKLGRRTFCAACTGLLIGATISLAGTILYFSGDFRIVPGNIWLVVSGEVLMLVGLTQIKFAGSAKTALNAVFVLGAFLIFVEVDALLKSLFVDLYVFGLILFLLWFRISLSEWNNKRTCHECQLC